MTQRNKREVFDLASQILLGNKGGFEFDNLLVTILTSVGSRHVRFQIRLRFLCTLTWAEELPPLELNA